jgi:hypothetical protein
VTVFVSTTLSFTTSDISSTTTTDITSVSTTVIVGATATAAIICGEKGQAGPLGYQPGISTTDPATCAGYCRAKAGCLSFRISYGSCYLDTVSVFDNFANASPDVDQAFYDIACFPQ